MEREKRKKQKRLTVLSKECVKRKQLQAVLMAQAAAGGGEAVSPGTGDGEPHIVDTGQPTASSVGRQGHQEWP